MASSTCWGVFWLWAYCVILSECLESLSVFALEHHFQLLPSSLAVISFFSINVKGFQVVNCTGIEDSSPLIAGGLKLHFRAFQQEVVPVDDTIGSGNRGNRTCLGNRKVGMYVLSGKCIGETEACGIGMKE